ncbi:MAG: membrane protein insertase YidC [Aquimonas sp.]|nr:membrane protein insertase YidC [Aquimonas sp.]
MSQSRTFLLIAWLMLAYLLWEAWHASPEVQPVTATESVPSSATDASVPVSPTPGSGDEVPLASSGSSAVADEVIALESVGANTVSLSNDVLNLELSTQGGSIVRAELLEYRQNTEAGAPPVVLMSTESGKTFVAQSGLTSAVAEQLPNHLAQFAVDQTSYRLAEGQDAVEFAMTWQAANGIHVRKIFTLARGSYVLDVRQEIHNGSGEVLGATAYTQIQRDAPKPVGNSFTNPAAYSFVGAAWYSPESKFDKRKFDDFGDEPLNLAATDGWVAMLEHYFFAAWIPATGVAQDFSTAVVNGRYLIRSIADATVAIPVGQTATIDTRFYVGPKLQDRLEGIAPGLKLTLDYGVFTVIAQPMAWLLGALHSLTGNWGWAIILLVLLLKGGLFKLSEAQYKSFAKMRAVQPRIEALKERYGEDRQKFQTAMMELYKKEKINPMGGCLPILVQIPVFISLYWVLIEAVELRHAPWVLWIQNLTAPDPLFVLPVLNLATMWLTQKLSPSPGMDPMQKRIMQIMPLAFGVMFAFFPAGLVLYWTTNGALGLLQQWIITKRHAPKP